VISQKKYEFTTQKKISNKKHGCSNIWLPNFMVSHNSLGTEKKRQVQVCTQLVIFFPFHMIELEHENLHLCIRLCVIISTILSNKPSYCHFLLCSVYTIRKPLISYSFISVCWNSHVLCTCYIGGHFPLDACLSNWNNSLIWSWSITMRHVKPF